MKKKLFNVIILSLVFATVAAMCGCSLTGKSGGTLDEPEITTEYLTTEYKNQLIRDGAEEVFGTAELTIDEDGSRRLLIHEKEFVEDDGYPNGFYIADKNMSREAFLSDDAKATFFDGGSSISEAMDADEFVNAYKNEEALYSDEDTSYYETKLYYFYIFDDRVNLMIARYIP